jgi:hypothetical protein
MSHGATWPTSFSTGEFFVPGTCFVPHPQTVRSPAVEEPVERMPRDAAMRRLYLDAALADVPRLLGAIDRNPYRPTYGCLDRQYWHYRTAAFPSQMYQEGVLPLALVYTRKMPGNRWHLDPRVRELAVAAMHFSARSSHRDGSCDDYYPLERALGAAVFSLTAATAAYALLDLHDPTILAWFHRRARWLIEHDESGNLSNHQALAALGLLRVAGITGEPTYREAAAARIDRLLAWQSEEGWFDEYGGADPGYQTVTIDCLAKIREQTGDTALDEPLRRAVAFARHFLHDDGSYAGEYGSRGTYHFYPHGMELLARHDADAATLADGFLGALATGRQAHFADDRMFAHRLGNLIEAYLDFSPMRPASLPWASSEPVRFFPQAGLLVRRSPSTQTIISAARGGTFKHFAGHRAAGSDAGLVVETTDGRVAVSQAHHHDRTVEGVCEGERVKTTFTVSGPLCFSRHETATPIKQAVFHAGMVTVGRACRTLVRKALQRRLITGQKICPIHLRRTFEFLDEQPSAAAPRLRVTDAIELTNPTIRVKRMGYGTDHQDAYVAASGVYQDGVLQPWTHLAAQVDELNRTRCVTVVREL